MESNFFNRFHDLGAFAGLSQSPQAPPTQPESTETPSEPTYPSLFGSGNLFGSTNRDNGDASRVVGASSSLFGGAPAKAPEVEEPTQNTDERTAADTSAVANPVAAELVDGHAGSPPLSPQPDREQSPSSQVPEEVVVETTTVEATSRSVAEEIQEPVEEIVDGRVVEPTSDRESDNGAPQEETTTMRQSVSVITGEDRVPLVVTEVSEETRATGLASPDLGHESERSPAPSFPDTEGIDVDSDTQEHATPRQASATPPPPKTAPAKRAKRVSIAPDANTKRRRRTAAEILRDTAGAETPKKRRHRTHAGSSVGQKDSGIEKCEEEPE